VCTAYANVLMSRAHTSSDGRSDDARQANDLAWLLSHLVIDLGATIRLGKEPPAPASYRSAQAASTGRSDE